MATSGISAARMQQVLFLNVPARQSKNYFDYLNSNIQPTNIVFVDALFGGLDVAARLKWAVGGGQQYVSDYLSNLISRNLPSEATLARVTPFFEGAGISAPENFIIVICRFSDDMRDTAHQNSFSEFMNRSGIKKSLRFGAVVLEFRNFEGISMPFYLKDDISLATQGKVAILEFRLETLDDPRHIVMDKLQQFSGIEATRTFFGVNYGKVRTIELDTAGKIVRLLKDWSGPILNWRRIFGW